MYFTLFQVLNLGANRLARLSLKHLGNLRTLYVHQNQLQSLGGIGAGLGRLETLYADKNNLSSVADGDLRSMPALLTLSLNGNGLQRLGAKAFAANRRLESLSLADNRLTTLDDDLLMPTISSLKVLQLANNQLTTISANTVARMANMQRLVLSYNHIDTLHERAFAGMYALERMYLDHNQLATLKNGTFAYLSQATMTTLDLSCMSDRHKCSYCREPLALRLSTGVARRLAERDGSAAHDAPHGQAALCDASGTQQSEIDCARGSERR